jgi:ribosomal protein L14
MLEVADNSGARKLQMILPLGGSTGLNAGLGDVITASVKEASPDGQVQKGQSGESGDRAHPQRAPAARWNLHPL